MSMTFEEFQQHVRELSARFTDRTPERRMMFLMTEVGEVAQDVITLRHLQETSPDADLSAIKDRLGMELHDVVWNIFELADQLDIDIESAFRKKITINQKREW